jgi:zinc protease
MRVLLAPHKAAPVVSCNVWVGVGSADETAEEAGLAHVHEHMLFKGTERRGVGQIASEVEAAGGHINAFTSFDQTCYYVVMSSRYFETGLDILSDAIRRSSFDAEELGRELEVIQEEIKRGQDNPARQAIQHLFDLAYEVHPYRLPVIGTKESVDSFTRDHVVNFFRKHYVPSNMAVVLAGDFEEAAARELVARFFGDFEGPRYASVQRPGEPAQRQMKVGVFEEGMQETYLRVGFHIPAAIDDSVPALDLLGAIMGGGESSPLYQVVQRERELVNSVNAGAYTPRESGLFLVSADYQRGEDSVVSSDEQVVRAVLEQAFLFRERLVEAGELARARGQIESSALYGKQTVEQLASKFGQNLMVTGDAMFDDRYYARLAQVTPEELREVARRVLTLENCTLVLTHPSGQAPAAADSLEAAAREAFELAARGEVETIVLDAELAEAAELPEAPALALDAKGFVEIQLADGPKLIVQEDHSVEIFAMRALMMGGTRYEAPERAGATELLAELVTRGTSRRSAVELAQQMELMASGIGGMSGRNTFGFGVSGLSKHLAPCLELFSECLFDATIPDDEFEREQKLAIQGVRRRQESGGAVNFDLFASTFFKGHPYERPTSGTEQTIRALTPAALREQFAQLRDVRGMSLVIVGDVKAASVAAKLESLFAGHGTQAAAAPSVPPVSRERGVQLVVNGLDKQQAHITVGFDGPTLESDSRYAMEVLHAILSGQGGRLFLELRDRQSLAYSVYASMILGLEAGAFTLHIGTSPEKIEQALKGMLAQIRALHDGGVSEQEIAAAKRYLIGNHDIQQQRNSSRAMSVALDELYGLGSQRVFEYGDRIEAVSAADINAFIARYLKLDDFVAAVTRPEAVAVEESWLH